MAAQPINLDRRRPVLLKNRTCVYCGQLLVEGETTKEHVIGRKFVPRGTLHQDWNLIVRACLRCNSIKGILEDDISAITMHPDAFGRCGSETAREESKRKAAGSTSRRTGKLVSESAETIKIDGTFGPGISVNLDLTAPPQVDSSRAFELARMQLAAFFYFLTYDEAKEQGYFWRGEFTPLLEAQRGDWGNEIHRAFMKAVSEWDYRLVLSAAADHFAVAIRKHPSELCWSWALEWNMSLRLVGFFGDADSAASIHRSFPKLSIQTLFQSGGSSLHYRREIALGEKDDIMFSGSVDG